LIKDVADTANGKAAVDKAKMIKADTLEELATKLGLDPAALVATVEAYKVYQFRFIKNYQL